jgi:hypothetical protein
LISPINPNPKPNILTDINSKWISKLESNKTIISEEEVDSLTLNGTVLIIILRNRLTIYAIMK